MYHLHCAVAADNKSLTWIEKPVNFMQNDLLLLKAMIWATMYTVSTIHAQLHLVILYKEAAEQCKLFHRADDDY